MSLLLLSLAAVCSQAQDASTWHVLIEPNFMSPPVTHPIPNAKKTVLVAGYMEADGTLSYFSKDQFAALKVSWDDFVKRAGQNKSTHKLNTQLVRDSKDVVQYAQLSSDSPLTATAVLAPDFAKKLAEVFGDHPLVVMPNRFTVFVFPKLASEYEEYSPMILEAFHATPYPVSLEVFEETDDGLKAIGVYDEP